MGLRWWFLLALLLFVLTIDAEAACTNTNPCVTDCTGCGPGDMVPDPTDCTRFYECDGNNGLMFDVPFDCPVGQVYDITSHSCSATAPCTSCPLSCSYDCAFPNTNGEVSNLYDCSSYYKCNGAVLGDLKTCSSSTPYYDGTTCQTDQSHCCHCHPFCYKGDTGRLAPDPTDCRKYYACVVEGVVPTITGTCPSGQNFDPSSRTCSASAPCITLCKNLIGTDGCIDPYTCEATGYFPKCPGQCTPEYYLCTTVSNDYPDAGSCSSGYVFHPTSHMCVMTADCP